MVEALPVIVSKEPSKVKLASSTTADVPLPVRRRLSVKVVAPVPPFDTPIAVAFHTPVPIVPSVVKFVEPVQVDRAVFSTRLSPKVVLRLAVVVPVKVVAPEAYKTSPKVQEANPVPPFATDSVPAETTPETADNAPVSDVASVVAPVTVSEPLIVALPEDTS